MGKHIFPAKTINDWSLMKTDECLTCVGVTTIAMDVDMQMTVGILLVYGCEKHMGGSNCCC